MHTFTMTVHRDLATVLEEVKEATRSDGVQFTGDAKKGTFDGKVSGAYEAVGNKVVIVLSRWPWYATASMVEDRFRSYFEQ